MHKHKPLPRNDYQRAEMRERGTCVERCRCGAKRVDHGFGKSPGAWTDDAITIRVERRGITV